LPVSIIIGTFAGLAAIGARRRPADSKDVLRALLHQLYGEALLAALAADPDHLPNRHGVLGLVGVDLQRDRLIVDFLHLVGLARHDAGRRN
jgi:hypothetical protein